MVDLARLLPQLTHVQRQAILQIGDGIRDLSALQLGSRNDAIRTLKSLFFLVERIPNDALTRFSYRLNADGLTMLTLIRNGAGRSGSAT
jgi:hypothetical protein